MAFGNSRSEIELASHQKPKLLQWQCQVLKPLHHQKSTVIMSFFFFFLFWLPWGIWSSQDRDQLQATVATLTHCARPGIDPVSQGSQDAANLQSCCAIEGIPAPALSFFLFSFFFFFCWFTVFCQFLLYSKVTPLYIYMYSFFHIILHYARSQVIIVPCCYTAGSHCSSTPNATVCIYQPQTPSPSHPFPLPLGNHKSVFNIYESVSFL